MYNIFNRCTQPQTSHCNVQKQHVGLPAERLRWTDSSIWKNKNSLVFTCAMLEVQLNQHIDAPSSASTAGFAHERLTKAELISNMVDFVLTLRFLIKMWLKEANCPSLPLYTTRRRMHNEAETRSNPKYSLITEEST